MQGVCLTLIVDYHISPYASLIGFYPMTNCQLSDQPLVCPAMTNFSINSIDKL